MPDIIFVTNKTKEHHADRFNGFDYVFPVGEKVQVPVEAATHMLGFNLKDKTDTLVRLGWASRYNKQTQRMEENPDGVKRLAGFVFTQAVMIEAPAEETA